MDLFNRNGNTLYAYKIVLPMKKYLICIIWIRMQFLKNDEAVTVSFIRCPSNYSISDRIKEMFLFVMNSIYAFYWDLNM